MKLRSSTKIVIGAVVLCGAAYFAWDRISAAMILGRQFEPLEPSEVSLVGLDTRAGYYVVVANQVAQLIIGEAGKLEKPEHTDASGGNNAVKKRIPLREMLLSLKGDEEAVGHFVMRMNDMSDAELPAQPRLWRAEDLEKALDGDAGLRKKLVSDLNVNLDGSPLESIRIEGIQEGIVIDSPVSVSFKLGKEERTVVGRIREEYRPRFMRELDTALSEESNQTADTIRGYYTLAARKLLENPRDRENVESGIRGRISKSRLDKLAELPRNVLNSITIIVNDSLITGSSYRSYRASDGKQYSDLTMNLSEEGRGRLWQFSKKNAGSQLLFVWDGIAIAAPRIQSEIPFGEVTIRQISDETLVKDTVDAINKLKKDRENKA